MKHRPAPLTNSQDAPTSRPWRRPGTRARPVDDYQPGPSRYRAAARSTNHVGPPGGMTSFAGYSRGSASPSRISLSASALPSPATRKATARAAFRTGTVSVRRVVSSFGTGLATPRRSVTPSAGVSGKRLAVCPSSPDAQHDEVEDRRDFSEELLQLLFVGGGGLVRRQLAAHPVDGAYGDEIQERLLGHPVVGVLVVRRARSARRRRRRGRSRQSTSPAWSRARIS